MSTSHMQTNRQLLQLVKLRNGFIALQLMVVLLAEFWFEYSLPYTSLKLIIAAELVINLGLFYYYRGNRNAQSIEFLLQVSLDILTLTLLLYFANGATNPFVSLLLLPVAIAAVTLPKPWLLFVTFMALAAYSTLLFTLDHHQMHVVDMQQHFIGMWLTFVLSALVVVLIVASLAQAMRQQERLVSQLREEQLRQEQLVALGTTAAQFAHQMATPLATANLLTEELELEYKGTYLTQLQEQLGLCNKRLQDFRVMSEELKQNSKRQIPLNQLFSQIQQEIQLNFADVQVGYHLDASEQLAVYSDTTLFPALLNLVQNAVQASKQNNSQKIEVSSQIEKQQLTLTIRDFGSGLSEQTLLDLGSTVVKSEQGFGMGVLLSHATLERLGAQFRLYNHSEVGAVVEVIMKLVKLT
ncbi:ATP-binding protein [Paraglaciecola arctica]|uniref:ATP-binding protein n=1 Tax=Paraglaciecola arctica TaxID=1128911 RepID=UPI001C075A75|nr:HAMP domain-containing sensor histidine kinase [Paraglaciecola arctica]MBU3003533.1 sensor histidine kinase [Paraglaciecola arctica]